MLTQQELKDWLHYNPLTGVFTWIKNDDRSVHKGARAGCRTERGERSIGFKGKEYNAGRLAWLYMYGKWPKRINHANGILDDDRITNLRNISYQEMQQSSKQYNTNTSGVTGVHWVKNAKKWAAYISDLGRIHLGYFENLDDAVIARYFAECDLGWMNPQTSAFEYLLHNDLL